MGYDAHVDAVEREVADIVASLGSGPVDAAVPTCPGWTVTDLMRHVGEFTAFWTHVLCEGTGRPKTPWPDMPEGAGIVDWYRGVGDSLLSELRATPPDQVVWTWVEDRQNAAFIGRRCAQELAVHRYDVEAARGAAQPIDVALAADGVEEIFVMVDVFTARGEDQSGRGEGETLGLRPADRGERWVIAMTPDGLDVTRAEGAADLTLDGAMSDLALVCYGRPALGDVTRTGDGAVLDAWYRAFTFG
jgi:uncharacterized protein (TIGR03083 family)